MAFQRQLRLEYGSWLLLNNACSITQIALDCGSPMAHFSHDFHAHFGQFPRQYQQSHGRQAARNDGEIGVIPA